MEGRKMSLLRKVNEFTFFFSPEDDITLWRVVNLADRQLYKGDDILFYHFHVTLKKDKMCTLSVEYDKKIVVKMLISTQNPLETVECNDERTFLIFHMYQLEYNPVKEEVTRIYLTLENNRITFDDVDYDPQIEPSTKCIFEAPPSVTFHYRHWIPLHPDDELFLNENIANVSQRTPMWFEKYTTTSTTVSGSAVGKLACGYWVEENEQFVSFKERLRKQSNMRFGRLHEDDVQMITMNTFPDWIYHECGSIVFQHSDIDASSSPDGLAFIPERTWNDFPKEVRKNYENEDIDPSKCVLEFKASYMSSKFPDYYIPQLYWEMMATKSAQAMLVRYKRRRVTNKTTGVIQLTHEAYGYKIYRDPDVEKMLIDNVKFSQQRPYATSMGEWIRAFPERYTNAQQLLKHVAESAQGIPMKIPEQALLNLEKKRKSILKTATCP